MFFFSCFCCLLMAKHFTGGKGGSKRKSDGPIRSSCYGCWQWHVCEQRLSLQILCFIVYILVFRSFALCSPFILLVVLGVRHETWHIRFVRLLSWIPHGTAFFLPGNPQNSEFGYTHVLGKTPCNAVCATTKQSIYKRSRVGRFLFHFCRKAVFSI